jgi:hypothetical protein
MSEYREENLEIIRQINFMLDYSQGETSRPAAWLRGVGSQGKKTGSLLSPIRRQQQKQKQQKSGVGTEEMCKSTSNFWVHKDGNNKLGRMGMHFKLYIHHSTQRIRCMNSASILMFCGISWWWPIIRAETCCESEEIHKTNTSSIVAKGGFIYSFNCRKELRPCIHVSGHVPDRFKTFTHTSRLFHKRQSKYAENSCRLA